MFEKMGSRPLTIIIVISILTLALIPFALKVKPQNSIEGNAIQDDPTYLLIKEIQETFGDSEETITIAMVSQNSLLTQQGLKQVEALRLEIEKVQHIDKVVGLTNFTELKVTDEELKTESLVPKDYQLSKDQKEYLKNHPLYHPLLISPDEKIVPLLAFFSPLGKDQLTRAEIINQIQKILDKFENQDLRLLMTGTTLIMHESNLAIDKDNKTILPLCFLVLSVLLFLIYRRYSFVLLPFLVTIISILWIIGVMGLLGKHLTAFTSLVPLVLFTICLCDSVHILNAIWKESTENTKNLPLQNIIIEGLKQVWRPCLLTSLTTTIGFFALATSRMLPVRELGILIGVGVLFAFVLSVTIVPIGLYYAKLTQDDKGTRNFIFFSKLMRRVGEFVVARTKTFVVVGLMVCVVCLVGVSKIVVGQESWGMFKASTSIEEANTVFEENAVGASGQVDVVLRGSSGTFKTAAMINRLQAMQEELDASLAYRRSYSIADPLKWIAGKYLPGGKKVPLEQAEIDEGFALMELVDDVLFTKREYINEDASRYRIKSYVVFVDLSTEVLEIERKIRAIVTKYLPDSVTYEITCRPVTWAHMVHYVAYSQVISFSIALIVISIIMGLFFKSVKIGLLAMVPNIVPVIVMMGMVGWSGVYFNSFIAMVACVSLGLSVDDTIHFVSYYQKKCRSGLSPQQAIVESFETVGFPIMITSGLLTIGMTLFYFSGLTTTTHFGLSVSVTCLFALLADLFLLAPLLLMTKVNFKQKD